jgi:hypothetical protein
LHRNSHQSFWQRQGFRDFDLNKLTIDNLCHLVKKLGIKGYASGKTFQCHQLFGKHVVYQQVYNNEVCKTSAAVIKKKLSTKLCKIQAFFHPDIFDQILQINSLKDRSVLENGTTANQTWYALAELYNNTEKDPNLDDIDHTTRFDRLNHQITNAGYEDINLTNFNACVDSDKEMKKFFYGLFKIWHEMKSLMHTVSGTHNSDPLAFVNIAKKNIKNAVSVHRLALYYFFVKCEEFPWWMMSLHCICPKR